MMMRITLAVLAALSPAIALAQAPSPAAPVAATPAPVEDIVRIALDTDKGRIVIALDRGRAPVTAKNFIAYVDKGWMTGQTFYRAMKYGDGGLIQGGVRDGAKLLPPIKHEATSDTGLKNLKGAIVMASLGPGTARSDFFILTTDIPAFDASATDAGFAVFGRVVEGMDVVETILAAPTSPTKGEGVMKGQMLEPGIRILKASRIKP